MTPEVDHLINVRHRTGAREVRLCCGRECGLWFPATDLMRGFLFDLAKYGNSRGCEQVYFTEEREA